ncbi:MAG: DUF72 domain-containing protein [Atribacterota bacterium]|jgi:uncharacterized protein YecE (DUF72 family)|nr:DUF72 domain-containing protein [Atribacterota bacterium]
MLYIGTSGFSYQDWIGYFYPETVKKGDMLSLYAKHFNSVEINASYYRIPPAAVYYQLQSKVPENFKFAVKANQEMTHSRKENQSVFQEFKASLKPLLDSDKLGCVLAQFPFSFHYNRENISYLGYFKGLTNPLPLVIEFRNIGWIREEVFEFLRENQIGICAVDQPDLKGLLPPITKTTSDLGYIRFHGRNKENWWQHEQAYQRYDYLYTENELKEWIPKIKEIKNQTTDQYIFMNNHYRGKAAKNALLIKELLCQQFSSDEEKKDF